MQKIIFLGKNISPGPVDRILAKAGERLPGEGADSCRVVLLGEFSRWRGCPAEMIAEFKDRLSRQNNYWEMALRWVDERERKLQFHKEVLYRGFSLWWFDRYTFQRWLIQAFTDIDAVLEVFESHRPEGAGLLGTNEYWSGVIELVAASKGITVRKIDAGESLEGMAVPLRQTGRLAMRLGFLAVKFLRLLKGNYRLFRYRAAAGGRPRIMVITHGVSWETVGAYYRGKPRYLNVQMGLIVEELVRRGYAVLAVDTMNHWRDGWLGLWKAPYPYVPSAAYGWYWMRARKAGERREALLLGKREEMRTTSGFREINIYKGLDLTGLLDKNINPERLKQSYYNRRMIEFHLMILNREKPEVVVITDENGSGRPLVTAARFLGIPCIGVQHGIIHQLHTEYIYPKVCAKETVPLCHKTAVFGENEREILTSHSVYTDEELVVTGQSRLDLVFGATGQMATAGSRNGPGKRKTVLFTSGAEEDQPAMPLLGEAFSQMGEDIFLVIKLHPSEKTERQYVEKARKYGIKNFRVVKKIDLYELLASCDLHISINSTVTSEAVVFGKPNLVLDTLGLPAWGYWAEQGVARNLSSFNNMKEAVARMLFDEDIRQGFLAAREAFVEKHYFRLDGKATERICDVVEAELKKGEKLAHAAGAVS